MSGLNACQPHGVSVFRGDVVLTDTASHRVGLVGLSVPIAVSPLIVSGLAGGRYGPSSVATLARPAGIVSVGGTICICDAAENSLLIKSGTGGLCGFCRHRGKVKEAFGMHLPDGRECCPLTGSLALMREVWRLHTGTWSGAGILNGFGPDHNMQALQGLAVAQQ